MPEPKRAYAVRMNNGEGRRVYQTREDYLAGRWSASMNAQKRRKKAGV